MIAEPIKNRAVILSGAPIADAIKNEVAEEVKKLKEDFGIIPCLVVVRVGNDQASEVYVGKKVKTSQELGIISEHIHLPVDTTQEKLLKVVAELNEREDVDGILVQMPLPTQVDENVILEKINPEKDVDGFHPINVGRLSQNQESLTPCTPAGVIEILKRWNIEIDGKHAVIVGRSNIVGKPMAMLLLQENATVTICHSRTKNLTEITSQADILVAAIGRAGFIKSEHIKEGATVIDVGINNVSDENLARELFDETEIKNRLSVIARRGATLVGDVNPKDARRKAAYFTPVPGGIGLLTVAMLMKNTIEAAKKRRLQ
ncbi:MAG: bifunctional 5,10-methylenetetrahydrofolate dehydrogenase/5,10-methenyltetrahydrofolate cyclohydrolase [Pyrinomonadaceae bacterium]